MPTYSTTNVPLPWMEPYMRDYMSRAQELVNTPYEQSPGSYTGPNGLLQSGWQAIANRAMQGSPEMSAARGQLTNTINGQFLGRQATMGPQVEFNPYAGQMNQFAGQLNPYANVENRSANVVNSAASRLNPYASTRNENANANNANIDAWNRYADVRNDQASVRNQYIDETNPYASMDNPYLTSAIDNASGDLVRNYNLVNKPAWDRAMQSSGSFGNTGIAEMAQNERNDLMRNLGRIGSDMRMNAYGQAANLNENQVSRRVQAGESMAGRQYGAGESLAGRLYGAGQQQAQNQYNSGESLANRQFQAGAQLQQNMFNAGQQQTQNMFQAGESAAGRQFQSGAQLQQNLFNAGNQYQQNMYGAGQQQAQNLYGAGNQFAQNQFSAGQDWAGRQDATNNLERGYMNSALGLAPTYANQDYVDANNLLNAGGQMQGFDQNWQNQQQQWFNDRMNYPQQRLDNYGRALGMNVGGTTTQQAPGPSTGSQLLGGALTGAGIYNWLTRP